MSVEKIRVLRIINRFNLGGPTFNVAYLTKYMDDKFETLLLGGTKDETEASSEFILYDLGIKPKVISEMKRAISLSSEYKSYKEIAKVIQEFKPHIAHTHAAKSGILGRLAAINNDVPIILHTFHGHVFHSYFGEAKTLIYKSIERYLAKRSTRIIAISQIQSDELSLIHKIADYSKVEIVHLGFDLSRFQENQSEKRNIFRDKYGLKDGEIAIGIIGRLVLIKNHKMFLDAVNPVFEQNPNTRFFVIGDGESKDELLGYCQKSNIPYKWLEAPDMDSPLCFTSWIKEIDQVMAGLDIVTLTSLNEGTPVSLIEAQSAGKPVVSTRVGGIEDIVVEDGSALLCGITDQIIFNSNLLQLSKDQLKRSTMEKIGQVHVLEQFSYRRLVNDMESLYQKLLEEKNIEIDT
jgi:glycosyltransferase involved in cell wall biosynthesis